MYNTAKIAATINTLKRLLPEHFSVEDKMFEDVTEVFIPSRKEFLELAKGENVQIGELLEPLKEDGLRYMYFEKDGVTFRALTNKEEIK